MEYLEGETLAERLKKGPLPLDQVLRYAIEIADALDKAHRKGITHRDLKPGNIMLTKSGTKLLDFGLAKLKKDASPANVTLSKVSTEDAVTVQGTILGTLQYMAPEQLEGKEVDARTDIFAFGVVVYEMATGKKAFEGKSQASLIAKILETDPPPMSSLQPMTPPALDRVVKKCLSKEPEKRWQAASDVSDELKWIAEGGSQATLAATVAPKGIRTLGRRPLILSLGSLLIGLAIAGLAVWNLKPVPPRPVSRFTIALPPGQQLAGLGGGPAAALSPDGTRLAYVASQSGIQQIYVRALDSLEARPILGTEGAIDPFFSPNGQWLGFFAGGKLKKVSLNGGEALTLSDAPLPAGGSWGSQGMIAFSPTSVGVLQQVSDAGGVSQPLSRLGKGETTHRWPEFLPGGNAVLFGVAPNGINFSNAQVAVQSVGTSERRNLVQEGMHPRYASSGHLIYAQGGNLTAVPFDPQQLEVTGKAVPVVEGVQHSTTSGAAQYSFSDTGSLIYVPGGLQEAQSRLVWVNRDGTEKSLAAPVHAYTQPRLSPDGRLVSVDIREQGGQVWLYDLARETLTRLTFEGSTNTTPVWTPDGKRIAFQSNKEGSAVNLFWLLADGSGGLERLASSENLQAPNSWSPDGQLPLLSSIPPLDGTSGFWDWVTARPSLSSERHSPKGRHGFPATGAGWHMSQTNRAGLRFTYSLIRARAASGKSQRMAGQSLCGILTGGSCSTATATR
jgi:Tol biopolymer transport system component